MEVSRYLVRWRRITLKPRNLKWFCKNQRKNIVSQQISERNNIFNSFSDIFEKSLHWRWYWSKPREEMNSAKQDNRCIWFPKVIQIQPNNCRIFLPFFSCSLSIKSGLKELCPTNFCPRWLSPVQLCVVMKATAVILCARTTVGALKWET